jgi:hypothetical protein
MGEEEEEEEEEHGQCFLEPAKLHQNKFSSVVCRKMVNV